jgi:hypothetical protein
MEEPQHQTERHAQEAPLAQLFLAARKKASAAIVLDDA